jgi:predicted RNA-binding protein with RPS1 domain
MSEETTGALTATENEQAETQSDSLATAATTDSAANGSLTDTAPVSTTAASNGVGATASEEVDEMALAMQQMPPLDEIDVPGGETERRGGRRNDRRGGGEDSEFRPGQVVSGTVVHIDHDGVLVDVGAKSEGLIRLNELSREPVQNVNDVVSVGDKIDVVILEPERGDGNMLLSKKRADFEKAWDRVQEALGTGQTLQAMVSDRVKGGLVVDLGIRGFVPASHVGNGKLKNLEKFVGQSVPLKVLEVDRANRKVVLSHRLATEEEREKEKQSTIGSLAEGQTRTGTVRRVTDYGAFVDLGGIDGLLHVSEMSWTRVRHPSDVVKVGQEVQVMILKLNLDQGRVSLGMRQILPDPWDEVAERFHVNDVVQGEVTRLVPFGAFVLLEGGVEGIIPNSELAHRRVAKPSDVVDAGQMVEVKVIDVRPEERRLTLSLRALQPREANDDYRAPRPAPVAGPGGVVPPPTEDAGGRRGDKRERRGGRRDEGEGDFRQYLSRGSDTGGVTLGDIFGDMLSGAGSGGGKSGKGGGKRGGRRRDEEEDEDLSDIDFDLETEEEAEPVDAEASTDEETEK